MVSRSPRGFLRPVALAEHVKDGCIETTTADVRFAPTRTLTDAYRRVGAATTYVA